MKFPSPEVVSDVTALADAEAAERCTCRRDEQENFETCFPHIVAALLRDDVGVEAFERPF